jgi:hypothetical protein
MRAVHGQGVVLVASLSTSYSYGRKRGGIDIYDGTTAAQTANSRVQRQASLVPVDLSRCQMSHLQ